MRRIIIYGIGTYGKKAFDFIKENDYILAGVCDSNVGKKGSLFFGTEVGLSEEVIENNRFDFIWLCADSWESMLERVLKNGVTIDKIKLFNGKILDIDESYQKSVYSQDGEELYLREYFADMSDGIYVDVEAFHPTRFSNTMWAHQKGWKGINIEPNPNGIELFNILRNEDININCGISNITGNMTYYRYKEGALNTFNPERVRNLAQLGYKVEDEIKVPVVTLQSIFDKLI